MDSAPPMMMLRYPILMSIKCFDENENVRSDKCIILIGNWTIFHGIFSDLSGCHILNKTSVDDLNRRMKNTKVTVHNFRPNIVVESTLYAEDDWDWIKIGGVIFRLVKPCTRCTLTTINPETGVENKNSEPLMTLRNYHVLEDPELPKIENYSPIMGLVLGVRKPAVIHVGDEVFVTRNSPIKVLVK